MTYGFILYTLAGISLGVSIAIPAVLGLVYIMKPWRGKPDNV